MADTCPVTNTTSTVTHWGPFLVESDGTTITSVDGHPTDPDPSPIGQNLKAATELRIAKPAVRWSWLEGGPGTATEGRGREPFVEIEWDEALELVAGELRRVKRDFGNQAIYGGSYGWGSAGRFHQPSNQIYRFLRHYGGYTDAKGTYSAAAAEAIVPHILGLGYHQAIGQQTSWSMIAEHTELFLSFGGLRLSNAQVTFGGSGPHHTAEWLRKCDGVEFISVGPLADDDADFVNGRWQPIRPGTDVALMAALIHTLIADGTTDEEFLDRYTHGWPRLRAYLTGESDGRAKDAGWASAITGIEPGRITALAREMVGKRTTVSVSLSIQRGDHGEQSYWMALALACALGQVGLPGGGLALGFGANGNAGAGQVRKRIPGISVPMQPAEMPVIPVSRITELLGGPGRSFQFNGVTSTYPDIRLVYWIGGNPFHHHQDLNRLVEAWQRPETIVVHEPFWNPMSKRADIVLPATTPLERNDLGGAETVLVAMQAAIAPQGEAKHDYEIFAELSAAARLRREVHRGADRRSVGSPTLRSVRAGQRLRAAVRRVLARRLCRPRRHGADGRVGSGLPQPVPDRSGGQPPADPVRADRAVLRGDRSLRLRRLPTASDLARAIRATGNRSGRATSPPSGVESTSQPAPQPVRPR